MDKQKKNQLKKSFSEKIKYALNEILLVVIGILIAVSINNWNENRKQKLELKNIFQIVKEDLNNDLNEMEKILDGYEGRDSIFQKVIADEYTIADYKKISFLPYLILGYPEISIDQRGFNLLNEFKSDKTLLNSNLIIKIINFYNEHLLEIKVDDKFRADDFMENFNYWKKNKAWWGDYINQRSIDGFLEYALNDNDYRNRVATAYFVTYKVFLPELEKFKEEGQLLIEDIN